SAVELGLFSELAACPLDGETLRGRLGLHQRGARDFFDALVALRMLERDGGVYRNTAATDRYLDRNKSTYVGGMLAGAGQRLWANWGSLTEALTTGKPQNGTEEGEDLFDMLFSDPEKLGMFAKAMTGGSLQPAEALARQFPWTNYDTFIDIGTAEGRLPVEVDRVHPHLSGGGFDLPLMRPLFEAYIDRHALGGRLRFYSGDLLAGPLPSAEVLVMGHILHDWNLEVKRKLLAKAYAALPKGGALIVYDQIIDDERRENAAGLLMSLNMLVNTSGGFDYTRAEGIGWIKEAGFAEVRCEHLAGPHSIIVGIK
ncbi:methyltransferase, partial [Mesorhizobium sp. USDA-HM6]